METKNLQKSQKELITAVTNLKYGFMSMNEYQGAVKSGSLKPMAYIEDDWRFETENPGHPLAASYRFKRIETADKLRLLATKDQKLFDIEVLQSLYLSLFDCCAAVRLSILETLFFIGDTESVPHIKELHEQEKESSIIRERARLFAYLLESPFVEPSNSYQIIVATENIDTLISLADFASLRGGELRWARPDTPDIIAFPGAAAVIEPTFLGEKAWQDYVDYLTEAGEWDDMPLVILDDGKHRLASSRKNTLYSSSWDVDNILQFIDEHLKLSVRTVSVKAIKY